MNQCRFEFERRHFFDPGLLPDTSPGVMAATLRGLLVLDEDVPGQGSNGSFFALKKDEGTPSAGFPSHSLSAAPKKIY